VTRSAESSGRLRTLAELVRAPAALSVPGDVVAGAVSAGRLDRRVPVLALSSICLYWAGMAANDWADRGVDAAERPTRPIPSGRITPAAALAVAGALAATGLAVAAIGGGRRALAVAAPLAGAVCAYDLILKGTPAGPAAMAACRGLDVLLGASRGRIARALPAAAAIAAHTYTVSVLSRSEVSGAPRWVPAATLTGTAAVAAVPSGAIGRALAGWYAADYGRAQASAVADPCAGRIRVAVGSGITGLPLLQGALTARAGAGLVGLLVAVAAPVGRRLARKISPT
jgi:4-hydroxybenzoate polyprenyltransferase